MAARFESAQELQLLIHYKEVDDAGGPWHAVRVNRLCALMRISVPELARLIRCTPGYLLKRMELQSFPAPIRLLLDLVEQAAHKKYLGRPQQHPLIPEL